MKAALALLAACGVPPSPKARAPEVMIATLEWRAKPADADHVAVTLVVDGGAHELGTLAGSPELCALARADAEGSQLVCAERTYFTVILVEGVLRVSDASHEVARIPVGPVALSVAPYRMPSGP